MPSNYPYFYDTVNFNIERASGLIQQAAMEAQGIAYAVLKNNPSNPRAETMMGAALRVIQNYTTQANISEASKKEGYLSFVSAMNQIYLQNPKLAGMSGLMDTICKSVERIMYKRGDSRQFPQIISNLDFHVDAMASVWKLPVQRGVGLKQVRGGY